MKRLARMLLDRAPRLHGRLRALVFGMRPIPRLQPHAPRNPADLSVDVEQAYAALQQAFDARRR